MKRRISTVLSLVVGVAGLALAIRVAGQVQTLPGSVTKGEQVIREKGCLQCHALNKAGGRRAPDFADLADEVSTPNRLAASIWNHSPRMFAEYESAGRPVPTLTQNDVSDLFSYFFAMHYFEPQGSATRGRSVFVEKKCSTCHSEVLNAQALNPFLSRWTELRDPTSWAEQFWNHVGEMDTATSLRGVRWPELSDRDIADLMSFLSSLPGTPADGPAFTIGEPLTGKAVFDRSCESCHSLGKAERSKVDLLKRSRKSSVAGYIAAMWNHAPHMRREGGQALPKLAPGEMRDVVAYLFLQQYFYEDGDAARGQRVYESKACASCHDGRRTGGAPDLGATVQAYTPISIAAAVWRHGPGMRETLRTQGKTWPQFQNGEMKDLLAYLNSRLRTQIAKP
jgi:cytochrome c2